MPVYYSVDVFSERRPDGSANGIPVFRERWKNVVATLYHELQEARTDPDVEDAFAIPMTRMLNALSAGHRITAKNAVTIRSAELDRSVRL